MVAFVLCGIMAGTQWMNVSAAEIGENVPDAITEETEVTSIGEVNYDMEQGGKQVFTIEEGDGEESELVIEEMPEMARTLNKTYKITRTKPRAWTAGFYVKVSSSKITRVYNKFYKAIRGKITNVKLSRESEAEGRLTFLYDIDGGKKNCGVKAKVLNKKLMATIF
ncbi:hypothetical protein C818_02839 [Lachnospiraceae bacterium MD308]|nr:hypothetical protein C818_02839 [Lachnospiraceae bacterium MD308]